MPDHVVEAIAFHHHIDACIVPNAPLLRTVSLTCAVDRLVSKGMDEKGVFACCAAAEGNFQAQDAKAVGAIWKAISK